MAQFTFNIPVSATITVIAKSEEEAYRLAREAKGRLGGASPMSAGVDMDRGVITTVDFRHNASPEFVTSEDEQK